MISISFAEHTTTLPNAKAKSAADTLIVLVADKGALSATAETLDKQTGKALSKAIAAGRLVQSQLRQLMVRAECFRE